MIGVAAIVDGSIADGVQDRDGVPRLCGPVPESRRG